jgi:phenolic acid decarboxylase
VSNLTAGNYSVTVTDANGCSTTSNFTLTEPDELRVRSITSATFECGYNISCNGASDGSIDLTPEGGATCVAYTYNWSNGATTEDLGGLTAGTYNVTVTDANGCSTTASITLTQPALLQSSGIAATYACGTNVSCNGANDGSINLTATGGADCRAYTFNWSNGATTEDVSNLTAGTYSVTVTDANGCSTTSSFTLTEPALLQSSGIAATYVCGTNVSCNGASDGSINLSATGGADCAAYSYAWSNGATTEDISGLTAGTYTVTVTDVNGCSTTSTFTLTQPAVLEKTDFSSPTFACGYNISCNGGNNGSINLTATGGADCVAYTYLWSDGATTEDRTGLTAGFYSVTVTDANGCSFTDGITLTEPSTDCCRSRARSKFAATTSAATAALTAS